MRVLVACEFSGVVRSAFAAKGHDAWSCDLLPTEHPGQHYECPVENVLFLGWDLMIAHPPCTYLAVSGARWFAKRQAEQEKALDFVRYLLAAPIERIALENPIGVISTKIRKPDQIIQPFWFGDPFRKTTCLWLKNLPRLVPTNIVSEGPRLHFASGKSMPKWYADAYRLPPRERSRVRSWMFPGIARAMAETWGNL